MFFYCGLRNCLVVKYGVFGREERYSLVFFLRGGIAVIFEERGRVMYVFTFISGGEGRVKDLVRF